MPYSSPMNDDNVKDPEMGMADKETSKEMQNENEMEHGMEDQHFEVPIAILGGYEKEFNPGDEVVLKIVDMTPEMVTLEYAPRDDQESSEMPSDKDAMEMPLDKLEKKLPKAVRE